MDKFEEELFMSEEPPDIGAEQIQEILDAKYAPADLPAEVTKLTHLTAEQKNALLQILKKFEALFDGTLGCWNTAPVELELKDPKCKPVHAKHTLFHNHKWSNSKQNLKETAYRE